jgi:hypothetical protein
LVCSDSDYTPLAIRLREAGVYVFGVGENKTPPSFRNACDNFILTQNLIESTKSTRRAAAVEAEEAEAVLPVAPTKTQQSGIRHIHVLLKTASDKYQDADGWVNLSAAGSYMKRVLPDFDPKTYGFSKLADLIRAFPKKYETKTYPGKGTTVFLYKCRS